MYLRKYNSSLSKKHLLKNASVCIKIIPKKNSNVLQD